MTSLRTFVFLFLFFSNSLTAREEVILTVPKCGTHYLKKIIEIITGNEVMQPVTPWWYLGKYNLFKDNDKIIIMGHCEPQILGMVPQSEKKKCCSLEIPEMSYYLRLIT